MAMSRKCCIVAVLFQMVFLQNTAVGLLFASDVSVARVMLIPTQVVPNCAGCVVSVLSWVGVARC